MANAMQLRLRQTTSFEMDRGIKMEEWKCAERMLIEANKKLKNAIALRRRKLK